MISFLPLWFQLVRVRDFVRTSKPNKHKIGLLVGYMMLILMTSLIPMDREIQGLNFIIGLKPTIQNLLHIPAYAILSILCIGLLKSCKIRRSTRIWLVIVSVVGFGVLNESVQMVVPGRYAGVMDMGLNTVGALVGILLYPILDRSILFSPQSHRVR